jgi:hypothetical protein
MIFWWMIGKKSVHIASDIAKLPMLQPGIIEQAIARCMRPAVKVTREHSIYCTRGHWTERKREVGCA